MMKPITNTMNTSYTALNDRMEKLKKSYSAAVKSNMEGVEKSIEIISSAKNLLAKDIEQNQAERKE